MTASHPKAQEAMSAANPVARLAVNGASMDQIVPQRPSRHWVRAVLAAAVIAVAAAGAWHFGA
jgi:hypothetical protein